MNYRNLLDSLMRALEDNPRIQVNEIYFDKGLKQEEIKELCRQYNLKLAASLAEFFSQVNGGIVDWRLDPRNLNDFQLRGPPDTVYGFAYFYTLDEMLSEHSSLSGPAYDTAEGEREDLRAFHPLDKNVEEALSGFKVRNGRLPDQLYYLRQGKALIPMQATLSNYMQALVEAKAFLWWQEAYALRPAGQNLDDLYFYLPQLFPNEQLMHFQKVPRLRRRQK